MNLLRRQLLTTERRMARRHKQAAILLADSLVVLLCFFLTIPLVYGQIWPVEQLKRLSMLFPALAMLGMLTSLAAGLPRIKLKTYASLGANGIGAFALLVGLGTLCLTLLPGLHFPIVGTITYSMMVFLAAILSRVIMLRVLLWVLALDRPQTRVLIYGAGKTGQQLASALLSHESIAVVAFVDDDPATRSQRLMGKPIYPAKHVDRLVRQYDIGRILLAMPSLSAPKQAQISRKLQALGVSVQALPSFAQLIGAEQLVENLTPVEPGRFLGRSHLDATLASSTTGYGDRAVLVSGAGGSVGSELCRQLLAQGPAKLVLYEVSEPALYTIDRDLRLLAPDSRTEIVPVLGSVTDARLTRAVLALHQIDTVFHAAAYKHVPLVEQNPIAGISNNVFGTRSLADACVDVGVQRFILISTDKAVRPRNVMGASKRLAELVVQDRAKRSMTTRFSIVRFGNVLGSSGSVIPLFREQIERGGPVTLTHEDVTRYFMTIAEASNLVLLAGSFLEAGIGAPAGQHAADVFVLDMGKPVKIRQLAEQMIHGAGYTVRDEDNPDGDIEIAIIGLRTGEKMHEELLIGQGLLTTPHPKILHAAEESLAELEMAHALRELGGFMATGDVTGLRQLTMQLVLPKEAAPLPILTATRAT
ncbi:MAG: nucleoside-diphosphate sugar epimerase/dehydratase [Paracoccaceae bacterium]